MLSVPDRPEDLPSASRMSTLARTSTIQPISHQSTNDKVLGMVLPLLRADSRVVDIGAGEGYFSMRLGESLRGSLRAEPGQVLSACDVFPDNFRYPDVRCDRIEADGRLPYPDESFDIACSLEVVEHVEDQFRFAREIFRVLKPGGIAILSTPNVLNINSRVRYLHSGFGVLFDPLSLSSTDPVHTSGHINPVSFYYLAYQLRRAGFPDISVDYDRFKTSASWLLVPWGLIVAIGHLAFRTRLERKRPAVMRENEALLSRINSRAMLTSRSIIAIARK